LLDSLTPSLALLFCTAADWERKHPARDRAVQLVTNIVAKHHSNGATYSYNHRITPGIPAEVMNAIGSAGAAPASAGNAAEGLRAHRLKNSSYAL
jgi:ABC-type antimicrobial peptide transport system ATPase subunit